MSFSRPRGLNHAAYLTRDTAKTVAFYTDVLGMRLVGHALDDKVGSTGEAQRFLHTFFEMADGSCIAFFDLEGLGDDADQTIVPKWVRHIALSVDSVEELEEARQRLVAAGIDVIGPVDHEGIWQSIYFFDHNDIRLELTYQTRPLDERDAAAAADAVAAWTASRSGGRAATSVAS
ncbi:VOC family protein [Desertimonas flava]|uniref:VOC family protein n=1 Tax=Desertimonas flava TaxID=2064846 RepID=UPI000E349036|nr:VOC family protein [Desertimonas flava]